MLVIGRNSIIETLRYNPDSVQKIILQEGASDKKITEIITIARRKGISIEEKSRDNFKKIFDKKNKSEGISQGVVAISSEFAYSDFDEIISSLKEKNNSLLVILDEIQDPHNLGAIIRTSAASGADAVILSAKNSAKVTHTVIKSSAGAVNFIPVVQSQNIYKTIENLKAEGFSVVGTDSKAGKDLNGYHFPAFVIVVLGNEGYGIRKNILKMCDDLIKIPLNKKVQSLNVSVAAGIILYEALRQKT